jgi:hypothetical protein
MLCILKTPLNVNDRKKRAWKQLYKFPVYSEILSNNLVTVRGQVCSNCLLNYYLFLSIGEAI